MHSGLSVKLPLYLSYVHRCCSPESEYTYPLLMRVIITGDSCIRLVWSALDTLKLFIPLAEFGIKVTFNFTNMLLLSQSHIPFL